MSDNPPNHLSETDPHSSSSSDGFSLPQEPVSYRFFWASLVAAGLCFMTIVWMVASNISVEQFGIWPRVLIIALLVIFVVASLAHTKIIPWTSRSFEDWRRPKVLGTLIYLVLGGAGFVVGIGDLFDPPVAKQHTLNEALRSIDSVGDDTGELLSAQDTIAKAVGVGEASLIRQNLSGLWGRPGCKVTYQFTLVDQSLEVESVRSPAGAEPYNPEFTVQVDRDQFALGGERTSVIEANEKVGFWPGFGVQFRYSTDGSTELLVWDHKKISTMPIELVRCE